MTAARDQRAADAPERRAIAGSTPLETEGRRIGRLMTLPAQLLLVFIVVFPLLMQV
jgi:hypothetical protein